MRLLVSIKSSGTRFFWLFTRKKSTWLELLTYHSRSGECPPDVDDLARVVAKADRPNPYAGDGREPSDGFPTPSILSIVLYSDPSVSGAASVSGAVSRARAQESRVMEF